MLRILQIGLGRLGQAFAREILASPHLKLVGAVDPAPDKAGRRLTDVCGLNPRASRLRVKPSIGDALARRHADVAILSTVSSIRAIHPQVVDCARTGLHVVSTCEELSFPWGRHAAIGRRIDAACKAEGVACLGTGVNPGFLMDYLPAVLSAVAHQPRAVHVARFQDASSRRIPFQQKIGAGLSVAAFRRKAADGSLRHVGLVESIEFLACALGWKLDRISESLRPIIAKRPITSGYTPIPAGHAAGVEQIGRGFRGRKEVIRLHFRAAVGEPDSIDRIEILSTPPILSMVPGGIHGDSATLAMILHAARILPRLSPGLKTMLDVPVPSANHSPVASRRAPASVS